MAKEDDSSTNPHPESYLADRLVAELNDENVVEKDVAEERIADPPINLHTLSQNDFSSEARVVLSSTNLNSMKTNLDDHITPFRLPQAPRDVLVVTQSSQKTGFCVTTDRISFSVSYTPQSDDLVLVNMAAGVLNITPVEDNGFSSEAAGKAVTMRDFFVMTPGLWRISKVVGESETVLDMLVFNRKYILEAMLNGAAGSKRKLHEDEDLITKRRLIENTGRGTGSDDTIGIAVFHQQTTKPVTRHSSSVIESKNTLLDFGPGDALSIRPKGAAASGVHLKDTEVYSLTYQSNIAINKAQAALFQGQHSVHGLVAVKVIRSRRIPCFQWVPTLARNWQKEAAILRQLDHVGDPKTCFHT